jgi:predicted amidohydrolase YtcJ
MAAARDRCGLTPGERLGAGEAHRLFTGGAAAAVGEHRSIAPGAPADLVVLDRDPVDSDPDGLRAARVIVTFVDGSRVPVPAGITTWKG